MKRPDFPARLGPAEVAWAVHLGCSTPQRLAREWGITPALARSLILGAVEAGLVEPDGADFWAPPQDMADGHQNQNSPSGSNQTTDRLMAVPRAPGVALWRRIAQDRRDRQSETTRAMHEERKAMRLRRTA